MIEGLGTCHYACTLVNCTTPESIHGLQTHLRANTGKHLTAWAPRHTVHMHTPGEGEGVVLQNWWPVMSTDDNAM